MPLNYTLCLFLFAVVWYGAGCLLLLSPIFLFPNLDLGSEKHIVKENANKNTTGKIVAVGEIGLDYHYDTDKETQKIAFKNQIEIANIL